MSVNLFFFSVLLTKIASNTVTLVILIITFWVVVESAVAGRSLMRTYNQKLVLGLMVCSFMYSLSNILYPNNDSVCKGFNLVFFVNF